MTSIPAFLGHTLLQILAICDEMSASR